jgi:hypothetical protein
MRALPLLLLALGGCGSWEEHLTLTDRGRGGWQVRWNALKRGLTGEGHLDSAGADWDCTPLPDGDGWTVQGRSTHWKGERIGRDPGTAWSGRIVVQGRTLRVDLKDAEGRAFPGNGSYPLLARTATRAYGRR